MFYNYKRFDFSRVGRYKINKRLDLKVQILAENRKSNASRNLTADTEIIRLNNTQGQQMILIQQIDELIGWRARYNDSLESACFVWSAILKIVWYVRNREPSHQGN